MGLLSLSLTLHMFIHSFLCLCYPYYCDSEFLSVIFSIRSRKSLITACPLTLGFLSTGFAVAVNYGTVIIFYSFCCWS